MRKLITYESPQQLIDAYINSPIFKKVVKKHEIAGSDYQTMLEDAVAVLVITSSKATDLTLKFARKYGALNEEA